MCGCVWDIDILYDYYKRNMSLTEDKAIALYDNALAKQNQGDYKGSLKDFTVYLSYILNCRPAHFGLNESNVVGKLRELEPITACSDDDTKIKTIFGDDLNKDIIIGVVHRGECPFIQKAKNAKCKIRKQGQENGKRKERQELR